MHDRHQILDNRSPKPTVMARAHKITKRRWLRFSLWTLFVVVTLCAPLAWLGAMAYEKLTQPRPNWNLPLEHIPYRQNTW